MGLSATFYEDRGMTKEIDAYKPGWDNADKIQEKAKAIELCKPCPLIGHELYDYLFALNDKIGDNGIDEMVKKYGTIYIRMDL